MNELAPERYAEEQIKNNLTDSAEVVRAIYEGAKRRVETREENGFIDEVAVALKSKAKMTLRRIIRPR